MEGCTLFCLLAVESDGWQQINDSTTELCTRIAAGKILFAANQSIDAVLCQWVIG